jgi:hypothetical protein
MKKGGTVRVEEGSGNVFADLGFPNPEREQLKAQLMVRGHSGNFWFGRAADGVFDCAGAGYRDCGEAKTAASAVRSQCCWGDRGLLSFFGATGGRTVYRGIASIAAAARNVPAARTSNKRV